MSSSDFFINTLKNDQSANNNGPCKSVINNSGNRDSPAEDDECNLINKDDFDEGKWKDIVTARATPIKANALARKNLSTARKLSNF